jgi:hypothetical protein
MSALARLTGGGTTFVGPKTITVLEIVPPKPMEPGFAFFKNLPMEIRLQIWEACLPGPRLITYDSRHNRELTLLGTCRESRKLIERKYGRVLCPGNYFPLVATSFSYVNLDTDIVIRDLTLAPDENGSLFDLTGPAFNIRCFALLSGLAQVKHLALGFDLLNENGGELFGPIQACCPQLQTLVIFPKSQLRECQHPTHRPLPHELRFLDFDSNFADYVAFRRDRCRDRILKKKAYRGLAALDILAGHSQQYKNVFPQYIEQFGQEWSPILKICMLTRWNQTCQGWQTRYMEMDRYSKGFPGEDGKLYRGFIESGMMCDAGGEPMSRYDGVRELFEEI